MPGKRGARASISAQSVTSAAVRCGELSDWQQVYAHPIYFTETFADPERNCGTCYRAANWTALGLTQGRGKAYQTHQQNRSLKLLFGYPLVRDFQRRLCAVA